MSLSNFSELLQLSEIILYICWLSCSLSVFLCLGYQLHKALERHSINICWMNWINDREVREKSIWRCMDVCVRACICLCFGLFHKRVWGGLQETPDLETRNEFLTILVLMPFSLWSYLFSCSKGIDFTFLSSLTLTIWNDCFSSSHVTLLLIYQ